MYWFNGGPDPYRRYYRQNRPRRRIYHFPWWLFFVFFWVAPNHLWVPLITVGVVLLIVFAIFRSRSANTWMGNQQPYYQPSQPPYQQSQMDGQSAEEPYYQPYNQGYHPQQPQAKAETYYQPAEQAYSEAGEQSQEDTYQSYDQPKAEYPQQMPPM